MWIVRLALNRPYTLIVAAIFLPVALDSLVQRLHGAHHSAVDLSGHVAVERGTPLREGGRVRNNDAASLVHLRYSGGNASYLEVPVTDTDLFGAQLLLVQTQQQKAPSLIQLYGNLVRG
jgi:hypothetical protein